MNDLWKHVKLGTPITGWGNHYYDNYVVVGLGHDWAVVKGEDGRVHEIVLEPTDTFKVGRMVEMDNMHDDGLAFEEENSNEREY